MPVILNFVGKEGLIQLAIGEVNGKHPGDPTVTMVVGENHLIAGEMQNDGVKLTVVIALDIIAPIAVIWFAALGDELAAVEEKSPNHSLYLPCNLNDGLIPAAVDKVQLAPTHDFPAFFINYDDLIYAAPAEIYAGLAREFRSL